MKKTFLFTMLLTLFVSAIGQNLSIEGRIISTSNYPVEYATVVLQTPDSVFISGGITDPKGHFQMKNLKEGHYNLSVSCIGYSSKNIEFNDFTKSINLGNLMIDSTSIALEEVKITASQIINQIDRKIVLPTPAQLKASTNGLSLLQQLQLSRITVDPVRKTVSLSGGETVQLRINGVEATIQEITALQPDDIIRVEHHDDPGLRYNGAGAVIDYITRRKDKGGYFAIDTQNSPHIWFGNNQVSAKFNYKKSEFSAFYYGGYRSCNNRWRENTETFNFEDGSSLTRIENGLPDKWAMNWNYLHFNYSYQEPEKYFFNATVRANINGAPRNYLHSELYPINHPEQSVEMTDHSSSSERRPSVDLYYQRSFKKNQLLILNVVGTYTSSDNEREYIEKTETELLTDIFSKVDGDKYSIIGEGIYEKGFKKGRLNAGIKHTQSFSDNTYTGNTEAITKMKQADTYGYIEIQQKIKKFNYSVGVGGMRSWFRQGDEGYQDYTFRPSVRLTYNFTDNSFIRYRGRIYSSTPSLSDLGETEQLIDSLQIRRGNPHLKPYTTYNNSLTYNIRIGKFSTELYLSHLYLDKPIMEQRIRENDKFVRTNQNQRNWQKLRSEITFKIGPIKDIVTFSFTTGMNYYDSRGLDYKHTYTDWFYKASVMANYKNWMLSFYLQSHEKNLYGEILRTNEENFHILFLSYKHKQISVGVMTLNPFTDNWKMGSENKNKYTPSKNWEYIKESTRLFAISFTYNFSFGRKYESASKRLNNEDNDSGVMSGGK
ncbi:MAG: TonB-dependent receptor family protein [Bacteroides sp.]|nr:TonB-dependent receptor family protein [Bacteroides sp.]